MINILNKKSYEINLKVFFEKHINFISHKKVLNQSEKRLKDKRRV
jgi:hypothetical protein